MNPLPTCQPDLTDCLNVFFVLAGRQVKMAFVNSVAKPPRDVRRRQEKFGTTGGLSTAASTMAASPIKSVLMFNLLMLLIFPCPFREFYCSFKKMVFFWRIQLLRFKKSYISIHLWSKGNVHISSPHSTERILPNRRETFFKAIILGRWHFCCHLTITKLTNLAV